MPERSANRRENQQKQLRSQIIGIFEEILKDQASESPIIFPGREFGCWSVMVGKSKRMGSPGFQIKLVQPLQPNGQPASWNVFYFFPFDRGDRTPWGTAKNPDFYEEVDGECEAAHFDSYPMSNKHYAEALEILSQLRKGTRE